MEADIILNSLFTYAESQQHNRAVFYCVRSILIYCAMYFWVLKRRIHLTDAILLKEILDVIGCICKDNDRTESIEPYNDKKLTVINVPILE